MMRADVDPAPSPRRSPIALDDIFDHAARRRPDALAIADAPNRATFTDGTPRHLTYAQAAGAVAAIAARLRDMALPAGSVVGIQMPSIAEHALAILGVMRAGLIPALLPLLWRRADAVAALTRAGAKALITCGRAGTFNHGELALRVAAEVFSIRYVCGFGANLPDGMVPLDDVMAEDGVAAADGHDRNDNAAAIAAITFDVGVGGPVPVARTHIELLAGGFAVLLESAIAPESVVLSTIAPASFAGLCLTLLLWILNGGTLLLHHPFNSHILGRQWRDHRFDALVLPAPVAFRLAETGAFAREGPRCIVAPWRAPTLAGRSEAWQAPDIDFVDVVVFGEAGLVAARRGGDGRPPALMLGPVSAPRAGGGTVVVELVRTAAGTLALRGAMVPYHAFPPGIERCSSPHFSIGLDGNVDTGYGCTIDQAGAILLTEPPAKLGGVGGYRFALPDLKAAIGRFDGAATLSAVPDPILGQRLIGCAADPTALAAMLQAAGMTPLLVAAFAEGGAGALTQPRAASLTGH